MLPEILPEGQSHALPRTPPLSAIPRSTSEPCGSGIFLSHKVRFTGDKKRAARRSTGSISLEEWSHDHYSASTCPDLPCSPISAYWDPHDEYELLALLGEGGQGACLLVQRKADWELRACKVSPRSESDPKVPREVNILRDILPPFDRIMKFYGLTVTPYSTQLYFDFYNGGDLGDFIHNHDMNDAKIPESFIWHALLHLAEAVAFLHYGYDRNSQRPTQRDWNKVIHRDIKPDNILLRLPALDSFDREYVYPSLVLADFGHATLIGCPYLAGTYVWQPPEIPEASLALDCWGVGAVIHAMALGGFPPINELSPSFADTLDDDASWFRRSRTAWPIREWYTRELEDCMFGALTHDPWKRFNALEILVAAVDYFENPNTAWEPLAPWALNTGWSFGIW